MKKKQIIFLTLLYIGTLTIQLFLDAKNNKEEAGLFVTNNTGSRLDILWNTETRSSGISLAPKKSHKIDTSYKDIDTKIDEISWSDGKKTWHITLAMPKSHFETFTINNDGAFESSRLGSGQANLKESKEITIAP